MQQPNVPSQSVPFNVPKLSVISVPLPSNGKVYPIDSPLFKKENLDVREMSANEEDLLTSVSLIRTNKAIDSVISACLIDKTLDINKLIIGDRNSILIGLVLASYGSKYVADTTCSSCKEVNKKYEFQINNLTVKELITTPVQEGTNEFSFTLPKSKLQITFKLLTSEDEKEIQLIIDRTKSILSDKRETNVTTRLKKQILSINGDYDKQKISQFIDNKLMSIIDSTALRTYIDEISPDIDTHQEFKCFNCNFTDSIEIPITYDFFWRSNR